MISYRMHTLTVRARFTLQTHFPKKRVLRETTRFGAMAAGSVDEESHSDRALYVLGYWLGESWKSASPWDPMATQNMQKWFGKSDDIDMYIRQEFSKDVDLLDTTYRTSWNRLYNQHASIEQCVAYIILGDQMCRNMHRGTPVMYQSDSLTLPLSKQLIASDDFQTMPLALKFFTLLPLMHSEDINDQQKCVSIFEHLLEEAKNHGYEEAETFLTQVVAYAKSHLDVVARYGRFPHRNAILGRSNTPEEEEGLAQGTIPSF